MIIAVDVGNFATKTSKGINFVSKVSAVGNLVADENEFILGGEKYFIEEGSFDTQYRKVLKENYLKLLYSALYLSNCDKVVELVLGLPIAQYKTDKDQLIERICKNNILKGEINGNKVEYFIKKIDIYPEGIGTAPNGFEGIICDVGGMSTDVANISHSNGKRKIINSGSYPMGTLVLYSNFIAAINSKFGLDLKINDVERLLKNGLKIDGHLEDITFAKKQFYDFVDELISKLRIDYSLSTNDIIFTGGGSSLLDGIIRKRLANATVSKNCIFDNVVAYEKYGREIWL